MKHKRQASLIPTVYTHAQLLSAVATRGGDHTPDFDRSVNLSKLGGNKLPIWGQKMGPCYLEKMPHTEKSTRKPMNLDPAELKIIRNYRIKEN